MSLKQDIERELKIPVALKMGRAGSLNVYADGEQIYSYQRTGKLPIAREIIGALRGRM